MEQLPQIIRIDPYALVMEALDLDPADFQSPLPVQHYRSVFADAAIGLAVGIWDTTTMQEAFGPYPGDEFITVVEGCFDILDGQGRAISGAAPQSATFRNAIPVSWKQVGYLRKIYLTLRDPRAGTQSIDSADGGVRVLDPDRQVAGVAGQDGVETETVFRNDAGTMTVTHCSYPAVATAPVVTLAHELCRVLAGEIAVTGADGKAHRFGPGQHFFVPLGTVCGRTFSAGTSALHVMVTA